ncbi:MAG TPA: hypothetical protein VFH27_08585, partial [Longimicrobiaceae bacterium]|nr:hypothetical protein [Longimicrobiaceae bacterium]
NFHSIYVTLLAESGVFALVLGMVLFFWPMGRSRRYLPLLAAFAAFNVFYQLLTEPIFWFGLAAAWSGLCVPEQGESPPPASGPAPAAGPAYLAEATA